MGGKRVVWVILWITPEVLILQNWGELNIGDIIRRYKLR